MHFFDFGLILNILKNLPMIIQKIRQHLKLFRYFIWLALLSFLIVILINFLILSTSRKYIYSDISNIPKSYTAIVLGAQVHQLGVPSNFLKDRLDEAIELYKSNKISRFLLSGDHGRSNYDEVNTMKIYLLENGIDTNDIFLDHAGFDTYSSMYRAREIFEVKDAIIVTQNFHLPRAVFIARKLGIKAYGINADKQNYSSISYLRKREKIANIKACLELLIHKKPKYLGEKIPITGDSSKSFD
jgi:SanA protein